MTNLKEFDVTVEKTMYVSGVIRVMARNAMAALKKVQTKIASGTLQYTDVTWGDLEYQDGSFQTTGDSCRRYKQPQILKTKHREAL